jgi:hypothetical protein
MRNMKRLFYITLVSFLFVLLATILHAAIEIPVLAILTGNMELYGNGWVWRNWPLLHAVFGNILWFGGAVLGYFFGRLWWRILYVEKRYGTPRW